MNTVRSILVGVALAVAAWLGWHFGSGELKKVKEELAAIEAAGKKALAEQQQAQDKLKGELAEMGKQHDEKVAALTKDFDGQKADLQKKLDGSKASLAQLTRDRGRTQAELADVRAQLDRLPKNAAPTQVADLKAKEQQLVEIDRKQSKQEQGLECLDALVPADMVASLDVGAR